MWTAIVTLGTIFLTVWAWWDKNNGIKAKEKADEDTKIDAANNAVDLMREFNKLRK